MCSHTLRRLQWIVIDCKRNLQQRQRILYKKILSVHIFQVHSEEFDELAPNTGLPVHVCCTFNELRSTFWLSDLVFPVLSEALGLSDNENLFTILVSIPPHHVFEKNIRVSPYLSWILNFCSLTLLRHHCLIGWVTIRVSPYLSILTLTFD